MLLSEWDTEEAKDVWFEEGRLEGREEGREEGIEEGREEGWRSLAGLLQEGKSLDEAMACLQKQYRMPPA